MGDIANEPSMEEILSSIKRIIAEDATPPAGSRVTRGLRRRRSDPDMEPEAEAVELSEADEVLELTVAMPEPQEELVPQEPEKPFAPQTVATVTPQAEDDEPAILSQDVLAASRERLQSLSAMVVRPETGPETLEGLVKEMLRPMLKQWLDANLPDIVERVVAREISRISGKS